MKVREFKDNRSREGSYALTLRRSEVEEFISQDVAKQILNRYLNGTDTNKLERCGTMKKLILLVRKAFKVHFTNYNIKGIKELDNITIGCKMPSKSGKNIASGLSLVK
jgi:hypothetical protein